MNDSRAYLDSGRVDCINILRSNNARSSTSQRYGHDTYRDQGVRGRNFKQQIKAEGTILPS